MEGGGVSAGAKLPPLPADGLEMGVLPRVIRTLVERRAVVKRMLKKEKARFFCFFFCVLVCAPWGTAVLLLIVGRRRAIITITPCFSVDFFFKFACLLI